MNDTSKMVHRSTMVAMRKARGYNGAEDEERVLEELSKQFGFTFKKL